MIYVCVPSRDEARTLGVVLWKIRRVLGDTGRAFTVVVHDDSSRDDTAAVLARYRRSLPLQVLGSESPIGYAAAVERLLSWVVSRSDYPRRDVAVVMQADLTEDPADLVPMLKRIEGGADLVASRPKELTGVKPLAARLLRRGFGRALESHAHASSGDALSGLRAYRVSVLEKAFDGGVDGEGLLKRGGWAANWESMRLFGPHARQVAEVSTSLRPQLRVRRSRFRLVSELPRLLAAWLEHRRERVGTRVLNRAAILGPTALLAWSGSHLHAQAGNADERVSESVEIQKASAALDSLAALYPTDELAAPVPFGPGETQSYRVELGWFDVGEGQLVIDGLEDVRGNSVYRAKFDIDGGILGFSYKQNHTTFLDVATLQTWRYLRETRQTGYSGDRHYEMYPEKGEWRELIEPDSGKIGSSFPLDDISFLYFLRQMELEVGRTYTIPRYFKQDGNPVLIRVLRRERREVDAGWFDCIVVAPVVRTEGLFAEGLEAEIYLSDDDRRLIVYLKTDVPRLPGGLELYLSDHKPGVPLNPAARALAKAELGKEMPSPEVPLGSQ